VVLPLADPLASLLQRFSEWITTRFIPERLRTASSLSEAELETLVELSAEQGTLHSVESEMIQEIIKLGDKTVRDCMTPRVDAFLLPDDLTNDKIIPKLRAQRRRYVPVYGETPDDIFGPRALHGIAHSALLRAGNHEGAGPAPLLPETCPAAGHRGG
jgi:CBS domain containing-hemolysin-like protein